MVILCSHLVVSTTLHDQDRTFKSLYSLNGFELAMVEPVSLINPKGTLHFRRWEHYPLLRLSSARHHSVYWYPTIPVRRVTRYTSTGELNTCKVASASPAMIIQPAIEVPMAASRGTTTAPRLCVSQYKNPNRLDIRVSLTFLYRMLHIFI